MIEIFSKCGINCGKCPWSRYTHEAFQTDEINVEYILTEEGEKKGATTPTGYLRDRGWRLIVTVDQTVNDQILKALHTYAGALDKKYGNKAFQHFSRVDMHVLAE
ncbi:MAG: hypothetical protein HXS40_03530 [Theionarchaea archaeon]|nr:hypothetical protein [Theionarchaea archaeon]